MKLENCDDSPMKENIKKEIRQAILDLQNNLNSIDDENLCLLSNFEKIKERL